MVFAAQFLDRLFFAGAGYANDPSAAELSIPAAYRKRLRAGLLIQARWLVSGSRSAGTATDGAATGFSVCSWAGRITEQSTRAGVAEHLSLLAASSQTPGHGIELD